MADPDAGPMVLNIGAQHDEELVEKPATLEEWKAKAEALWALLDDIDTYGDMFKPEHTNYFKKVNAKAAERFQHLKSDGYRILNA